MPAKVSAIPAGYHQATPYLNLRRAAEAIDFYKRAFGAVELMRIDDPSGRVGHAELKIGDAHIMLSDEFPEMGVQGPESIGGSPVTIHLYVEDVDTVVGRAVSAGARITRPVEDHFYGDRGGKFVDPFGHIWWIATHIEDVSPEEMQRRAAALHGAT